MNLMKTVQFTNNHMKNIIKLNTIKLTIRDLVYMMKDSGYSKLERRRKLEKLNITKLHEAIYEEIVSRVELELEWL